VPGGVAACPPPRAKPRMRERKAKRPESGRGAGENNGHGVSRSRRESSQPTGSLRSVRNYQGARSVLNEERSDETTWTRRRRRSDQPSGSSTGGPASATSGAERGTSEAQRIAAQPGSTVELPRIRLGAPWIPRRASAGADRRADGSGGGRPQWNGPDCATQERHSGLRARLSLRLKRGSAPFQPKLTSPASRSETKGRSPRPRMTWSRISIWRIRPASTSWRVMRMSSAEGVASPLG
jgi:hypothetical protein